MWIKGFENIFSLTEFAVEKSCGEHSVCTFCASVDAAGEDRILSSAGQEIQVIWDEGGKSVCVFCGRVEEVRLHKMLHSVVIKVRAVSLSAEEDEAAHTRIWQNPQKKLGAVLSTAQLALIKTDLRLSKALVAQQYAQPILQNQETNFAFLRRIAAYMDVPLWAEDTKQGRGTIVLAEALFDAVHTIAEDDVIRYEAIKRNKSKKEITLTLKKYLPLGSRVRIPQENGEYVIGGLRIYLEHAAYEFCYRLEPYAPWKYAPSEKNHLEKTLHLKGTVENNKDPENKGRIQVSFSKEQIQDMDQVRLWIPYYSPYTGAAGGIVFLPDVGDKVNVVFSNEDVYAASALRENALADECRNVEEKYIGNNTGRRIFFQEKVLKIASGEHTVLMDDNKIELTVGKSRITMEKDRILLRQGTTELSLEEKGIRINTSGSGMAWNEQGIIGNSKKQIGLKAQGALNIAGGSGVNVDAQGTQLSLRGSVVNIG